MLGGKSEFLLCSNMLGNMGIFQEKIESKTVNKKQPF